MTSRYQSPILATLSGILDRIHSAAPVGQLQPGDRLEGKLCLVTGANTGLGQATALELARRGGQVLMAGRTLDENARAAIAGAGQGQQVWQEHLDLARLQSVDSFCARMRQQGRRFHLVVANAGVVPSRARRTVDGLEESFQVNYLANLLLVGGLLRDGCIPNRVLAGPAGSLAEPRPRIIFVSSEAHRSAAPLDWDRLGSFQPYGVKGSVAEYGRAKLLLTTLFVELARRLAPAAIPEVGVYALCPGAVRTRIGREAPWWSQPALQLTMRLFFRSPRRGAEPVVYLGCAPALEGRTGVYLHGLTEKEVSPPARDPDSGQRLWEASLALLAERGYSIEPDEAGRTTASSRP